MERAAKLGYATATDLADALVYKGVPFRDAHEAVAKVVKHAMGENVGLDELPLSVLQSFHPAIGADVQSVLTLKGSLGSRNVLGVRRRSRASACGSGRRRPRRHRPRSAQRDLAFARVVDVQLGRSRGEPRGLGAEFTRCGNAKVREQRVAVDPTLEEHEPEPATSTHVKGSFHSCPPRRSPEANRKDGPDDALRGQQDLTWCVASEFASHSGSRRTARCRCCHRRSRFVNGRDRNSAPRGLAWPTTSITLRTRTRSDMNTPPAISSAKVPGQDKRET